jgi:predicted alpha/beta superfamily hydrolase
MDLFAQMSEEPIVLGKRVKFFSKTLNEQRPIQIFLPESYSDSTKKYPVLYVLDGYSNSQIASLYTKRKSSYNAHFPEMIVIGINNVNRDRDFSLINNKADKILAFIKDELIPFIDSTYRTEQYRILFGHSLTGNFCLYTLPKVSDLFNGYIILTPAIEWEQAYLGKKNLKDFLSKAKELNKKIYIGFAEDDRYNNECYKASFLWLDSLFKSVSIKKLDFKLDVIEREDHWSEPLMGLYKGLDFIYYPWRLPMNIMVIGDIAKLRVHIDSISKVYGYTQKYPEELLSFFGEAYLDYYDPKKEKYNGTFKHTKPLYESAIEIYKLNLENYPNSSNAYYELGNAYMLKGDKKSAIQNFKKALQINPKHKQANDNLEKLEK